MSIQIIITGNLTDAPTAALTQTGQTVAHFTVISNSRYRDRDTGEWVDGPATPVRVTAWGRLGESAAEHLGKGDRVTVTGHKLAADAYVNRDGEPAATLEVTAHDVQRSLPRPARRD